MLLKALFEAFAASLCGTVPCSLGRSCVARLGSCLVPLAVLGPTVWDRALFPGRSWAGRLEPCLVPLVVLGSAV